MKPMHLQSEGELLLQVAARAADSALIGAELIRRRAASAAEQELEHRWGKRDADIFRLDEYGQIVHLRSEEGTARRYWTHPEGYDAAYIAAITLALAITAGYQPGAPG